MISGGPSEIIDHEATGLLAESSVAGLARSMRRLVNDADGVYARCERNARSETEKKFGYAEFERVFQALVK